MSVLKHVWEALKRSITRSSTFYPIKNTFFRNSELKDSLFDSNLDQVLGGNVVEVKPVEILETVIRKTSSSKSIDFGNESDDSVVIIEDSTVKDTDVVPGMSFSEV